MSNVLFQMVEAFIHVFFLHAIQNSGIEMRMCWRFPSISVGKYNHHRGGLNCNAFVHFEQLHHVSRVKALFAFDPIAGEEIAA